MQPVGGAYHRHGFPVLGWLFQAGTGRKKRQKNFKKTAFFLEKCFAGRFFVPWTGRDMFYRAYFLPTMVDRSAAQLSLIITSSDRHAEYARRMSRGQGMKMEVRQREVENKALEAISGF